MTNFSFNFDGWDEVVSFAHQVLGTEGKAVQEIHITPELQHPTSVSPAAPVAPAVQPTPVPVPQAAMASAPQPAPVPVPAPVQQPVVPAPVPVPQTAPAPAAVPTTTAAYTLDDLARAAMPLMDAGRQADLQQLLKLFGVEALPALQPGQYGAFATKLREMGAQI